MIAIHDVKVSRELDTWIRKWRIRLWSPRKSRKDWQPLLGLSVYFPSQLRKTINVVGVKFARTKASPWVGRRKGTMETAVSSMRLTLTYRKQSSLPLTLTPSSTERTTRVLSSLSMRKDRMYACACVHMVVNGYFWRTATVAMYVLSTSQYR